MGSLQLECPLCCSEVFPCHNSLKYHLLSISDNLICPACEKRFEKIHDLAMHLGRKCSDEDEEPENHLNELEKEINPVEIVVKQEQNNEEPPEFISVGNIEEADVEEEEATEEPSDTYYCSSCAISFTSIEDHLQQYHEGHEVFLEEEEEPEDGVFVEEAGDNSAEIICSDELLNTIEEEECVDKAGRLYTRKVVKIEKFWDEEVEKSAKTSTSVNTSNQKEATTDNNKDNTFLEIYQCSKCDRKFPNLEESFKHKCPGSQSTESTTTAKYKKCKVCNTYFVSSKFLAAHMKTHKVKSGTRDLNPPYICEICSTEFTTYKSLRLHRRMHEPIKSKDIEPPVTYGMLGEQLKVEEVPREMFMCELCNKPYNKEYEEAHKKFHSKESDFNCEVCNRKFYTQENLEMHMRAHSDTKKVTCSYCKKAFLTAEKLEAHMTSKCQKRQYECQYCGRRFARPHEKVKHERIHTGEKPHVCEICGKAFRVSYCLTLHMRTHSGTRPYRCDHCGKRFKAHSVYNHHLLTHSDDRKYKCPFCPKTFKTGVQLAGHKNSHTKPFTCTECNRPFASLYAVRAHMETHQRQNNLKYKCWLCGASYARAFALRDHIKEQHVDEQAKADANGVSLENDDFIGENVQSTTSILPDADDSMLIDIGAEGVDNMEIPDVQVEPDLQDSNS